MPWSRCLKNKRDAEFGDLSRVPFFVTDEEKETEYKNWSLLNLGFAGDGECSVHFKSHDYT